MTPTKFNLYASRVRGKQTNTSYPYPVEIAGIDDLKKVAAFDHTAGKFADKQKKTGEIVPAYRSLGTFQGMDGDIFDCDNDPENPFDPDIPPEEWKTPADIDAMFPNVESYTVYSRHHMKEKNGKPARPKFHKYYPRRKPLATTKQVTDFHQSVRTYCPAFDKRCLDAAHFIYGVENPVVEYVPGDLTIDEFMEQHQAEQKQEQKAADKPKAGEKIIAGTRNSTLSSAAFTYLKKYGETDKAARAFMETAAKCEPPLEDSELKTIWNSAVKGYREKVLTDPNYLTPDEYVAKQFRESLEPQDETDVGQARVFVNHYGDRIRYSTATKWLVYDGRQWKENDLKVQGLVQELTDRQLEEAKKRIQAAQAEEEAAAESGDDELKDKAEKAEYFAKQFRGFVLASRKTNRISATMTEARPAVQIEVSELDKDPFLLNTPDGTVDLRTLKIKKHDPNDYCTKMTAVAPSMKGMDEWKAFLDRLTCGDKDVQEYLQIVSGMEIVGKVFTENLIIAHGSGGNGKSTFFNAQFFCLGDYAGNLSAETLTVNCRKNKSPEYAELRGKRFILAAELEEGMRLDTAIVKKLCSTDPILAEKKYKDPFTFIPSHTVVLYTNHLPKVGTTDKGTWDRLVVIPFNANFRGMQGEIKNYAEYLFEHCGGAILLWMIQGAKKYIDAQYIIKQPQAVKNAIERYRDNNDWLDNFLGECCDLDKTYTEKSGELYKRYKEFCDSTGDYRRSLADFKQALTTAGFETKRTNKGAIVYGLRLAVDALEFRQYDGPTPFDDVPPLTG